MTSQNRLVITIAVVLGILGFIGFAMSNHLVGAATTLPDGTVLEVYCPEGEICPDDDVEEYVLTGFVQNENPVVFEYWPGQVPCNTNTNPPFPCPAGGNSFNVPDSVIEQGIEEWSNAPSPVDTVHTKLSAMPASSSCGGVFTGLDTLQRANDGRNTVMWAPLNGTVIGIACWWIGTNECDIILDNTWTGAAISENVRTVLLHESGHCMGLSHTTVAGSVMVATFGGPRHLGPDDIAGYCAMYGCSAQTPATATSTSTPTVMPPTPTPTATPVVYRCGQRIYPTQPICKRIPYVGRD